jgi:septal ring factor EnvC (AmiA/AmiB activator)
MKRLISLLMVLAFSVSTLFFSSCTSRPNEEQIQALEEARSAALAAEKECSDKKSERQEMESQVNAKKAELEKVQAEKEKVAAAVEARKAESMDE